MIFKVILLQFFVEKGKVKLQLFLMCVNNSIGKDCRNFGFSNIFSGLFYCICAL